MSRTEKLASAFVVAAVLGGSASVGLCAMRAAPARAAAVKATASYASARQAAQEIARLKAAAPAWMAAGRPEAGLTQRLGAALQAAGLPAQSLGSASVSAEAGAGGAELKAARLRASVALGGLTLPQVGKFLAAWRSREPRWTVASIDLSPESSRGQAAAKPAGGDQPLRATIILECLFVDETGG